MANMRIDGAAGAGYLGGTGTNTDQAKVTLFDSSGNLIYKKPISECNIRIPNTRIGAIIAAGSLIWAMRYTGANKLRVKSGILLSSFDGTAAATTQEYQIVRISASNTTGGTPISPVKVDTNYTLPTVDARFNYGAALGVTGVTIDAEYAAEWGVQRQVSAANMMILPGRPLLSSSFMDLRAGEGIAIRLGVASVAGDGLGGHFELHEVGVND